MQIFTIKDNSGLSVELSDFGARIIGIAMTHQGSLTQLACRYPDLQEYADDQSCVGASVGPIANRLAHGKLRIQNREYQLPVNHGRHCLHSGGCGFDKMTWQCVSQNQASVEFSLSFPQGRLALPGNLEVSAKYSVADRQLRIDYRALTDQATYLNMTNHVYLNLNSSAATVVNHKFTLCADSYAELNEEDIPTGNSVAIPNPLGYSLETQSAYPQLQGQVDHHFIVNEDISNTSLKRYAHIVSPDSGISVLVSGTQPGFQFYTGQFLSAPFEPFAGFCVEPQFVPNAINQVEFSSPLTTPECPYQSSMTLDFASTG